MFGIGRDLFLLNFLPVVGFSTNHSGVGVVSPAKGPLLSILSPLPPFCPLFFPFVRP